MTESDTLESADILGVTVHAVSCNSLLSAVRAAVTTRSRLIIGHHNMNGLSLVRRYHRMRDYYQLCNIAYADGMAVVGIARALGYPFTRHHRITALDFIDKIFAEAAARGWRIFYLGSTEAVVQKAETLFRSQYPGLEVTVRSGYFDARLGSAGNAEVIANVNSFTPDILIVGMGMPRQEIWLAENHQALTATVLFPIGALADYLAGAIPTPPRWAGRWGLEWAFRLAAEPRRLARRYLLDPWTLIGPFTLAFVRSLRRRASSAWRSSQG